MPDITTQLFGPDDEDDRKKEEKDPMAQYAAQLTDMVEQMSAMVMKMAGCSDTDTNPMSLLQKGMDFFNGYDSDARAHNEYASPAKGVANTEELETVATLAI